jgi:3-hydroxyacyl-[acyl-carrier-protein] dehydratase
MRDYAQIRQILPHGAAMVLVDRVDWLEPGRALRAYKAVSGCEPCYHHLPPGLPADRYAYPVSLIIESFGQAALVLWHSMPQSPVSGHSLLMFAAARNCRFEGRVYPGDVLRHEVEFERSIADTGFAKGETWVGDRLIATMGSFIAVARPAQLLPA